MINGKGKSKSAGWYRSMPFEGTGIPKENIEQVRPRFGGHCTCSWISFLKLPVSQKTKNVCNATSSLYF